jgi:hypothetical protein
MPSPTRNPFGVEDVPEPNAPEVEAFASRTELPADSGDPNAERWDVVGESAAQGSIEGEWGSRWNGGAAGAQWKTGRAQIAIRGDRFYALFDWDHGLAHGVVDARRDGDRLIGRYLNLGNPDIRRPWTGLVVDEHRIDGRWPEGHLDFRR